MRASPDGVTVLLIAKRNEAGRKHAYLYDIELDGELIVTDARDPNRMPVGFFSPEG